MPNRTHNMFPWVHDSPHSDVAVPNDGANETTANPELDTKLLDLVDNAFEIFRGDIAAEYSRAEANFTRLIKILPDLHHCRHFIEDISTDSEEQLCTYRLSGTVDRTKRFEDAVFTVTTVSDGTYEVDEASDTVRAMLRGADALSHQHRVDQGTWPSSRTTYTNRMDILDSRQKAHPTLLFSDRTHVVEVDVRFDGNYPLGGTSAKFGSCQPYIADLLTLQQDPAALQQIVANTRLTAFWDTQNDIANDDDQTAASEVKALATSRLDDSTLVSASEIASEVASYSPDYVIQQAIKAIKAATEPALIRLTTKVPSDADTYNLDRQGRILDIIHNTHFAYLDRSSTSTN